MKELNPAKENLVLLNKADLLSEEQRSAWARFFEGEGVRVVFWSALEEAERLAAGLQVTLPSSGGMGRCCFTGSYPDFRVFVLPHPPIGSKPWLRALHFRGELRRFQVC